MSANMISQGAFMNIFTFAYDIISEALSAAVCRPSPKCSPFKGQRFEVYASLRKTYQSYMLQKLRKERTGSSQLSFYRKTAAVSLTCQSNIYHNIITPNSNPVHPPRYESKYNKKNCKQNDCDTCSSEFRLSVVHEAHFRHFDTFNTSQIGIDLIM